MPRTVKDIMIEDDASYDEAQQTYEDECGLAFDRWKERAKEEGTYHNPLIRRDV